jgi:hypothetical protein
VTSDGTQANDESDSPVFSADGRYVAFWSRASNLVAGDTNNSPDVFVHDRLTGQTTRVSIDSNGGQANEGSIGPTLSADGRYVAFYSAASNLVADDTDNTFGVFVHDRQTGRTMRVSVPNDGMQLNVPVGESSISADGRYIAFSSLASNLVADDTNGVEDVFVVGGVSVTPTAVSVGPSGGSRTIDVTFDYLGTPWTATTTTPWITITPPGGGSSNGTVTFSVAPNTGPARTGTLVVALQTVTVTQEASTAPVAQNGVLTTMRPPARSPTRRTQTSTVPTASPSRQTTAAPTRTRPRSL